MEPQRRLKFWLADPERSLLRAIATRLPERVNSDHLTALGIVGALGTALGYALSSHAVGWLWLASAMLVVNWFGDSLDGTLARVRQRERPKYGYYLDHAVDAFSTAVVGVGIGLSPFVDLEIALLLVVGYLTLSINTYLESTVFGVFQLSYSRIGPTETRLLLIGANTVLFLMASSLSALEWVGLVSNGTAFLLAAVMLVMMVRRFAKNLNRLASSETAG